MGNWWRGGRRWHGEWTDRGTKGEKGTKGDKGTGAERERESWCEMRRRVMLHLGRLCYLS